MTSILHFSCSYVTFGYRGTHCIYTQLSFDIKWSMCILWILSTFTAEGVLASFSQIKINSAALRRSIYKWSPNNYTHKLLFLNWWTCSISSCSFSPQARKQTLVPCNLCGEGSEWAVYARRAVNPLQLRTHIEVVVLEAHSSWCVSCKPVLSLNPLWHTCLPLLFTHTPAPFPLGPLSLLSQPGSLLFPWLCKMD